MAIAHSPQSESMFDSAAVDLLECFCNGFDTILSDMAESLAAARAKSGGDSVVTAEDIEKAAQAIVKVVQGSDLPDAVKEDFEEMMGCLETKASCRAE